MKVFKFGGASVKDADALRNVSRIIQNEWSESIIVVVSAMGKTTNKLEEVVQHYRNQNHPLFNKALEELHTYHKDIIHELHLKDASTLLNEIEELIETLENYFSKKQATNPSVDYDFLVAFGELLSTKIVHFYLNNEGFPSHWLDARTLVRTDEKFQEANVVWDITKSHMQEVFQSLPSHKIIAVTQGFIGATLDNRTTTLGREGSDFTAAIFAYCMNATSVTIWKDVPGMLNADPKYFKNTVLLEKISFGEAIELSYYGASVIHPKTVKPLQNKNIPLFVKSFIETTEKGTIIHEDKTRDNMVPSYIFKFDQVLFTISPLDFSFLVEENLSDIFNRLSKINAKINLMQNSALSFSILLDRSKIDPMDLRDAFIDKYIVKYNEGLELITIRHYDEKTIKEVTEGKKIIVQQRTRSTARFVVQ